MSTIINKLKNSPFILGALLLLTAVVLTLFFTSSGDAERIALINQDTALGDKILGNPDADVTVIEYYSSTCNFCATFHTNQWPEFEEKYVKTNQIKFVMRPFFLNNLDAAAMVMTYCVADNRHYDVIDELLKTQNIWASSQVPRDELQKIAGRHGLDAPAFEACLKNDALVEKISNDKAQAQELGVTSTPSFFINGVPYKGQNTAEELGAAVEAAMAQ